jgi:hypothetical protein
LASTPSSSRFSSTPSPAFSKREIGSNSDADRVHRLGVTLSLLDISMTQLPAVVAEKEESKAANSQNLRQGNKL